MYMLCINRTVIGVQSLSLKFFFKWYSVVAWHDNCSGEWAAADNMLPNAEETKFKATVK